MQTNTINKKKNIKTEKQKKKIKSKKLQFPA